MQVPPSQSALSDRMLLGSSATWKSSISEDPPPGAVSTVTSETRMACGLAEASRVLDLALDQPLQGGKVALLRRVA
jgi:hypothetical protein